jgi:hypothetical protein
VNLTVKEMLNVCCRKEHKLTAPQSWGTADIATVIEFTFYKQLTITYSSTRVEKLTRGEWLSLLQPGGHLDLSEEEVEFQDGGELYIHNQDGVIHFHTDTARGGKTVLRLPVKDCEDVLHMVAYFYEN